MLVVLVTLARVVLELVLVVQVILDWVILDLVMLFILVVLIVLARVVLDLNLDLIVPDLVPGYGAWSWHWVLGLALVRPISLVSRGHHLVTRAGSAAGVSYKQTWCCWVAGLGWSEAALMGWARVGRS